MIIAENIYKFLLRLMLYTGQHPNNIDIPRIYLDVYNVCPKYVNIYSPYFEIEESHQKKKIKP